MRTSLFRYGVLVMAVLAPSLTGCFLFDALDKPSGSDALTHATYRRGCGPTDGPAIEIFVTEAPTTCEALDEIDFAAPELAHVWVTVYGISEPEAGHSQAIGPLVAGPMEGGWARRCPGGGAECALVVSGGVEFGETDEGTPTVEVNLEFTNDERVQESYVLRQCEQVLLCG